MLGALEHKPGPLIREVQFSNLGSETGYHDRNFSRFSSVPPIKLRNITPNYASAASVHIISIYYSLITLFNITQPELLTSSLNYP
jgi:hypothetical protein